MTTWYIKPDTGTDSNASAGNGDSAATARKTLSNIVAAALAPGDSIRYVESPAPVSLGVNGTWTKRWQPANVNISSSTNATPIVVTTSSAHGRVTGDTVFIASHTTNTNANGVWTVGAYTSTTITLLNADGSNSVGNGVGGASGTVTDITRSVVTLATAQTKNIAAYGNRNASGGAWTASANVTCSVNTSNYKEGGECQSIAIAAGFTTGKAAYFALGSAQDFSAYQKVCFWVYQSAGTLITSGQVQLQLCSDAAGTTPVDTINFDVTVLNVWTPVVYDKGSALGASIQSINVNVVTDSGAQTFLVSNIFAANSLTLGVGIGKSTGNYLHAQSINGTRVILDGPSPTATPTIFAHSMGYHGTSSTETVYLQSMFQYSMATSSSTQLQVLQDTGSAGNPITISGGWDAATMSSQTGKTWFDGRNGRGYGLVISSRSNITANDKTISFCRYYRGVSIATDTDCDLQFFAINHNDSVGFNAGVEKGCTLGADYIENNNNGFFGGYGAKWVSANCNGSANYNAGPTDACTVILGNCDSAFTTGNLYVASVNDVRIVVDSLSGAKVNGLALSSASHIKVYNPTFDGNATDILLSTMDRDNGCVVHNPTFVSSPIISGNTGGYGSFNGVALRSVAGSATDDRAYTLNGTVLTELSTFGHHLMSPKAVRLYPTNTTYVLATTPFVYSLGTVKLKAGNNEISVQAKRSNTGLSGGIIVYSDQVPGLTADVSDTLTVAADTLETLVLSVAPTNDCEVEVHAFAYGGTTYNMFVDDLKVKRGSFSGNITETFGITNWVIEALNAVDGSFAGRAESSGTTYTLNVNTNQPCHLTIAPKISYKWSAAKVVASGDIVCHTDPDATPHLWYCTTPGTTGGSAPSWNLSGTTTDNTVTWTYLSPLGGATQILGVKIPTAL